MRHRSLIATFRLLEIKKKKIDRVIGSAIRFKLSFQYDILKFPFLPFFLSLSPSLYLLISLYIRHSHGIFLTDVCFVTGSLRRSAPT